MTIQNSKIYLVLILFLAAFLRFYQLGINPPSLDWDEVSLGYNAYSLLKTGKDEFGRAWPISIRSFEDYKPAVYTYLTIPAVAIFGLNEFAVRLPGAILGTLTVLVTYFLVRELFNQKMGFVVTLLLAISPWHLQFSRVAFEASAALFFVVTGCWLFLKGTNRGKWLILSVVFLVLSFYTYHSPRLVVPLILLGWGVYFRHKLWQERRYVGLACGLGLFLLLPFFQEAYAVGRARFTSVTVMNSAGRLDSAISRTEYDLSQGDTLGALLHNRRIVYALAILKGYLDHFNLDFLFFTGDSANRHHAQDMGMLYFWEEPFVIWGMWQLLKKRQAFPVWWWYLMAPSAAAITTGTPHAVRALIYLPTYQIFTALGLIMSYQFFKDKLWSRKKLLNFAKAALLVIVFINVFYYLQMYYIHTPVEVSRDWQYGSKQAVTEIAAWDSQVEKIIMTYSYDQPHTFALFYMAIDPSWYQQQVAGKEVKRDVRSFGKYEFRNIDWEKDEKLHNVLLIGTGNEIPAAAIGLVKEIKFLDGTIAFRIVKR